MYGIAISSVLQSNIEEAKSQYWDCEDIQMERKEDRKAEVPDPLTAWSCENCPVERGGLPLEPACLSCQEISRIFQKVKEEG